MKRTSLWVVIAMLGAGCMHMMHRSDEVSLASSTDNNPAARGAVKTAGTTNENTRVEVKVEHLAPPGKVASGATTYVVWAKPQGSSDAQNIGALRVDDDLKGTLRTVLPYEAFKVFITAEPNAQVTSPTGEELLAANITPR